MTTWSYPIYLIAGGLFLQGVSVYPALPTTLPPGLFTPLSTTDMTARVANDPNRADGFLLTVTRGDVEETYSAKAGEQGVIFDIVERSTLVTNAFWVGPPQRPANGTYDFRCDPGGSFYPWRPRGS